MTRHAALFAGLNPLRQFAAALLCAIVLTAGPSALAQDEAAGPTEEAADRSHHPLTLFDRNVVVERDADGRIAAMLLSHSGD